MDPLCLSNGLSPILTLLPRTRITPGPWLLSILTIHIIHTLLRRCIPLQSPNKCHIGILNRPPCRVLLSLGFLGPGQGPPSVTTVSTSSHYLQFLSFLSRLPPLLSSLRVLHSRASLCLLPSRRLYSPDYQDTRPLLPVKREMNCPSAQPLCLPVDPAPLPLSIVSRTCRGRQSHPSHHNSTQVTPNTPLSTPIHLRRFRHQSRSHHRIDQIRPLFTLLRLRLSRRPHICPLHDAHRPRPVPLPVHPQNSRMTVSVCLVVKKRRNLNVYSPSLRENRRSSPGRFPRRRRNLQRPSRSR